MSQDMTRVHWVAALAAAVLASVCTGILVHHYTARAQPCGLDPILMEGRVTVPCPAGMDCQRTVDGMNISGCEE